MLSILGSYLAQNKLKGLAFVKSYVVSMYESDNYSNIESVREELIEEKNK